MNDNLPYCIIVTAYSADDLIEAVNEIADRYKAQGGPFYTKGVGSKIPLIVAQAMVRRRVTMIEFNHGAYKQKAVAIRPDLEPPNAHGMKESG